MNQGADYVATGHYAMVNKKKDKVLLAGIDKNKDQSYFLWNIKRDQFSRILFPVGNLEKSEVRKLAKKFNLPTANKKDSQGVCFLGKIDIKDFLSHYIKVKNGLVLNEKAENIGFHNGASFLTIGERGGFSITKKGPNDKPLFIVAKDLKNNTITVSQDKNYFDHDKKIVLRNLNFLVDEELFFKKGKNGIKARVRYRQPLEKCKVNKIVGGLEVKFEKPQVTASGQSVVFYDGEVCLGGGIIA
jgi:tRNA-specific 2-thiouridylase